MRSDGRPDAGCEGAERESAVNADSRVWWREREVLFLLLLVLGCYFVRLTTLPVCGEESRWARVAHQMIHTGDWIIPRQQGQPYIDRPPLANWAIAVTGLARGKIDEFAIRFPSVLAVLLTTWMIYGYARTFLGPFGALVSAAAFCTGGQLLQLGRLGENEALYTLLAGGSLLLWHWGYAGGWPKVLAWIAGYTLAALAMLIKGPQAPVYFVAATGMFLLLHRQWRWIFGWQHAAGLCAFALTFSLWAVPFYFATDWQSFTGMFTRSSAHRYASNGLLKHLATYPFETFACLLPWSPLLIGFLRPGVRRTIGRVPPHVWFLVTAVLITYPSVLLAANARSRYFMPLYPCLAVLIGWMAERSALAANGSNLRRAWELYLLVAALAVSAGGVVIFGLSVLDVQPVAQPAWFGAFVAAAGIGVTVVMLRGWRQLGVRQARAAVLALASFAGLIYTGVVINVALRDANDMTQVVADLKEQLPPDARLVSFGPVDHRFAYYHEAPIPERPWPIEPGDVPPDVEYFCYTRDRGDTAEVHHLGRGIYWSKVPGTLPFQWEEVAALPCDRRHVEDPQRTIVIGRIVRRSGVTATAPSAPETR